MKYFPPYQFDERQGVLTSVGQPVPLTRKASEVLGCLLDRAGSVVLHQEILEQVWAGTHVQADNIKVLVRELRRALGDDPHHPRFIRSEPGRGYAFIGHVTDAMPPVLSPTRGSRAAALIGRDAEVATLHRHLRLAVETWTPQLVLVGGEYGLGKTHLCRSFARDAANIPNLRVSGGQGLEVARSTVDLSLLLEALDGLERQYPLAIPNVLARCGPTRRSALTFSADTPHLFLELSLAFDKIAADAPLVLVLEDLQWADQPTLDFLRAVGRRQPYARLCVVGTYATAPDPAAARAVQRLLADWPSASTSAITLRPWTSTDLSMFLEAEVGQTLAKLLQPSLAAAGGGNPAMAAATVEHLRRRAGVVPTSSGWRFQEKPSDLEAQLAVSVAESVRRMADSLSPENRRVLAAAAEYGDSFSLDSLELLEIEEDRPALVSRIEMLAAAHVLIEPVPRRRGVLLSERTYRWRHAHAADFVLGRGEGTLRAQVADGRGRALG